jgi:hypothetical protein
MRGRDILDEVLEDAKQFLGMEDADSVIVGGCSAGGLSAYLHADKIREALPNVGTVKAVADAGFFIDAETVTDVLRHRQLVQYETEMFNISGGVNPRCVAQYGTGEGLWHCFMAQYTLPHVSTPVFLFNSMYDTYQLQNYFAPVWLPGVNPDWSGCVANASDCSLQQQALVRTDWREQFITALRDSGMLAEPATSAVGHGAFAHGCFLHCGLGPSEYVNLTIGGVSLRDAISQWFLETPDPAGGSYIHLDAPWPGNPYCPA